MAQGTEIEFKDVSKRFGEVLACDSVSFQVKSGSIHGLVGENGAGKSTLMKMLYGMYIPDSGEILLKGEAQSLRTPLDAIRHGIGMVHQHFMLVPTLSVWRNIILGSEGSFRIHKAKVLGQLSELKTTFGFTVNLKARIENLPVGEQQQVEILKLLYRKARTLILDEPTAVLTPQEVDALFARLKELSRQGTTIVLITHKLKEVLALTDTVTVLRGGKAIATAPTATLNRESLAEMIVGTKIEPLPLSVAQVGAPVLKVENLTLKRFGHTKLDQLNFEVRAGEIVGIAGVSGNGQDELVQCLSGVETSYDGKVSWKGTPFTEGPLYPKKQQGLAVIPSDRLKEAAVPAFAAWSNAYLGHHREDQFYRGRLLDRSAVLAHTTELMQRFDVRPRDTDLQFSRFSGGNQQKLVIARETHSDVSFLVAAYPTRGVDIGAIQAIHAHFLGLRSKGTAIVLVSSELDEILAIADRILVLYSGRFAGETTREKADERTLGLWMTGAHK